MTNRHPVKRPNARRTQHTRADIHGRTEEHLDRHERLEFLSKEDTHFVSRYVKNRNQLTPITYKEWPRRIPDRCVVEAGGGLGVFLGYLRGETNHAFAVVDRGSEHGGIAYVDPDLLEVVSTDRADAWQPIFFRNQGKRVQRALRDMGAVMGKEDVMLRRIIQILQTDLMFLRGYEARRQAQPETHLSERDMIEGAKFQALVSTKDVRMPVAEFSGARCFALLTDFGIPAGNTYHGMFDMMRAFVTARKAVAEICPDLLKEFERMESEIEE